MKLDQIAYCVRSIDQANQVKAMLGLQDAAWVEDRVTTRSTVWGTPDEINIAHLMFCDALGIQFELIRYMRGRNWLEVETHPGPFVSHVGYHLAPDEPFPAMVGCRLAQEAHSLSHTCEYLTTGAAAGRKYHYRIYEVSKHNYMKFIRRIEP